MAKERSIINMLFDIYHQQQTQREQNSKVAERMPDWFTQLFPSFGNMTDEDTRAARRGDQMSGAQQQEAAATWIMNNEERVWQEQMYEKYQSYSGQVEQMKNAGLNPAMMYDGVNLGSYGSAGSASAPAGMATSANPALDDSLACMQQFISLLGQTSDMANQAQSMVQQSRKTDIDEANVTGQNSLRAEQIKTEQKKQDYIQQQADNLRFQNSTNPVRWTWEVTNQANKEAMAAADLDLKFAEYKQTMAEIDKLNNDKRIDNLRYDLDYLRTLSDIAVNNQNIKESGQRIDNLKQQYNKLLHEVNIADYQDTLNVMRITYGVSDDALALACDSVATNISDDKQRAQFVASVRRMSVSKSVSAGNMWSFIDKYMSDLGMFGRAEWQPTPIQTSSNYGDLIPPDYSGE